MVSERRTRGGPGRGTLSPRPGVRTVVCALASIALVAGIAVTATGSAAAVVPTRGSGEPAEVEQQLLAELASGASTDFWVYLAETADLTRAASIANRTAQGRFVYQQLTSTAERSQAALRAALAEQGVGYESFWLANAIKVTGGEALVAQLADRPEVARIAADRTYRIPEPVPGTTESRVDAVEWNIDRIGAPQVWSDLETTGAGIVVGSIDTGVQFDHPTLADQYLGNSGDGPVDHNYHWWDPSNVCGSPSLVPCDNDGHGTHTMGTMVGDDGGENQIGVAPGAKWIAAKGCEARSCSQEALLSSGQFILAPTDLTGQNPDPARRPHVVNNSWGGNADTDPWYVQTVQGWVSAGIFPQFSNGNSGPACGTASNPGNLADAYAAGAFDINDQLYGNSSRGPSAWDDQLIKPNIAAPGVNVRSAAPGDGYAFKTGTSMASPHVAGTVALMWSASPALVRNIDATRAILDSTAIDTDDRSCGGTAGNNNVWGQGRLDAFAAVELSPPGPTGALTGTVVDATTQQPVGGATVSVTIGDHQLRTTAGADGSYTVDPLPVGTWQVAARAVSHRLDNRPATITDGGTTTLNFALTELPHVTGVVSAAGDGSPVAGVTVTATGEDAPVASTTTGADGSYRLYVELGTWTVSFARVNYVTETRQVAATADGQQIPLDVTLRALESWAARYNGPGGGIDVADAIQTSPDGSRVFVTGRSVGDGTGSDFATVAYGAATGDQLWVARYAGPTGHADAATALAVSPDGSRVFVTGYTSSGTSTRTRDYATVGYDAASGAELWLARYDGPGAERDTANAIGVSLDGSRVFVTGSSDGGDSGTDSATIGYDAATGAQAWLARSDSGTDLEVSAAGGRVLVTGRSTGEGTSTDYATLAYDPASGDELWLARYSGPAGGLDLVWDIGVSPDGSRAFVTGYSEGAETDKDYATVAYDTGSGDQLWLARYAGTGGAGEDLASAVGVSPDGSTVFVTGASESGLEDESRDYATVAYRAASGTELWTARYDPPANAADMASDLGVSPDGSAVFVTGESWTDAVHLGTSRYATVAYDTGDGREQWVAEYPGPDEDPDAANALTVSPDAARVFVTGQSKPVGAGNDYATAAYRTGIRTTLTGTVTDANDQLPLAGATVTATRDGSTRAVVTDASGGYALSLPAGQWTVEFTADRYAPETREAVIEEGTEPVTLDAALRTGIGSLTPDSLDPVLPQDQQQTFDVQLANPGSAELRWEVGGGTVGWLAAVPASGQLEPGAGIDLVVTVDATGLASGTHAGELVLVTDAGRVPEVVLPVQLQVTAEPGLQLRLNAGGPAYTDLDGDRWEADQRYRDGYGYELPTRRLVTNRPIDGTEDDDLYQRARIGDGFAYRFDGLEDGLYQLELHFAEVEPRAAAGERRFDVVANGETLLAGYDIAADAGVRAAVVHRFTVEVTGGGVRIWFLSRHDSAPALVSALQLTQLDDLPPAGSEAGPVPR